jgi:hypothetical protein
MPMHTINVAQGKFITAEVAPFGGIKQSGLRR